MRLAGKPILNAVGADDAWMGTASYGLVKNKVIKVKHKKYPCGWGNPNDIGSGLGETREPSPPLKHVNCHCKILVQKREAKNNVECESSKPSCFKM